MLKKITVNGETWRLQVVSFRIEHGFEVVRSAKVIRIVFNPDAEVFAGLVAEALVHAVCVPVLSRVE